MNEYLSVEVISTAWIILGVILIVLEFFIPGAVIIFFGGGAVLTGILYALGILEGWGPSLAFWLVSSLSLVLLLRRQVRRWFPAIEQYQPYDEETDIRDQEVTVLEEVNAVGAEGRVRFQGSSWQAISLGGPIPRGSRAKISRRENLVLYVLPLDTGEQK